MASAALSAMVQLKAWTEALPRTIMAPPRPSTTVGSFPENETTLLSKRQLTSWTLVRKASSPLVRTPSTLSPPPRVAVLSRNAQLMK
jgi:hypothetical protein